MPIHRFVIVETRTHAPCLVCPTLFCMVTDIPSAWSPELNFCWKLLHSSSGILQDNVYTRSLFCQEAEVRENNFISPELSKKEKIFGFVCIFKYLSQCQAILSNLATSSLLTLLHQNYHKPSEIWESDVSFSIRVMLQADKDGRGNCHCISQDSLVEMLIDNLYLGKEERPFPFQWTELLSIPLWKR